VQHLVELVSVEEDGHGDELTAIWEVEPGARVLEQATLPTPVAGRFDGPSRLDAFLDAVRWGAITSADSKALQAPFRSGITIEDYQLDPVVRALDMPRVNLLIADDVGLGKTIEAGLVAQELLLRHRARTILIVCPASLTLKWQGEMANRFGLEFRIIDSQAIRDLRRTRGIGANPFTTYPRLIVSIDWLKRERGMRLLGDVLPPSAHTYPRRFDLLIVDEVHTCAPAGRGKYAIDSQRTQAIRTLSPHFEHRLFLSATPHNGYTESFTALLELLDPQRFHRNVRPTEEALRRSVVRRLKSQLRDELPPNPDGSPRFPKRTVVPLEVDYPDDERQAHAWLHRYTEVRRTGAGSRAGRTASDFVTLLLKKRLFSSPEAFARTLDTHRATLARQARAAAGTSEDAVRSAFGRLEDDLANDTDLDEATEDALSTAARAADAHTAEETDLLNRLEAWAAQARGRPDAKAQALIDWLLATCTEVDADGTRWWNEQRVIVFTEFRHTQSWLHTLFTAAGLAGGNGDRLALLYGGMDTVERERIKAEFQYHPDSENHPEGTRVRILLATDAASEGIDLQRQCHLMAHVEIPFSPTRLEQRNGRIDRHGQPAPEVSIHHFVGRGWEDAQAGSLEADLGFLSLVARKVESIRDDLGSVGEVLAEEVEAQLLGTRRGNVNRQPSDPRKAASRTLNRLERELRERTQELRDQLSASVDELGLTPTRVERVVRTALDLASQPPLRQVAVPRDDGSVVNAFELGALNRSWATATLDLRHPVTGVVLPITFDHDNAKDADDVVLAHLGHRLVAQSMRLLRAEVWATGAASRLSRVCAKVAAVDQLTVVAHARLVLTGGDGHRLHEELIQTGGRVRGGRFARLGVGDVRAALDAATEDAVSTPVQAELAALWDRIHKPLADAIDTRGTERADSLRRTLGQRETDDRAAIRRVLTDLRATITAQLDELEHDSPQLTFDFNLDERAQLDRDVHALRRRIETIPEEIELETAAIARRYADPVPRLFPAAVTFLVPPGAAFRTLAVLP
jgi:superfamily II DNA or RNA helicase